MFFKSEYHEKLFETFISKLKSTDRYYTGFAYVAAAIEKETILKALDDHRVDYEMLLNMSGVWSNSEKAMLEVAWQMFNGRNLYDENEKIQFPTINSIFFSLDSDNSRIVLEAITMKYFR